MSRFVLFLVIACLAGVSGAAHAWGPLGHRLVARLAQDQLTPGARAEVRRLLALEGARSLADVANWADQLRERDPGLGRRSAKWHYVNIAEHDCVYDARRDCPGGDCVVAAISAQAAILGDRSRSDAERLQALKFVVHFTGDIHQPMHAGYARDKGGNTVQVNYRGRGSNLHAVWDSTLLESRWYGEWLHYRLLRSEGDDAPATASTASPRDWAEASCRIVRQPGVYPGKPGIDDDYIVRHRPIAEAAIQRAGKRLAGLLNDTLD